jgi:hypothetical protein
MEMLENPELKETREAQDFRELLVLRVPKEK